MKKLCKIFTIIIVSLFIILFFSKNANAADTSITGIMDGGDFFVSSGKDEKIFNDSAVKSGTSQLYFICLGVGIFAAVIGGIILGIQFVTTGVSGQAKVKEKFLPYAIGCVVVFGGFGIWKAVINIGQGAMPEPTTAPDLTTDPTLFIGPTYIDMSSSTIKPPNTTREETIFPPEDQKKYWFGTNIIGYKKPREKDTKVEIKGYTPFKWIGRVTYKLENGEIEAWQKIEVENKELYISNEDWIEYMGDGEFKELED